MNDAFKKEEKIIYELNEFLDEPQYAQIFFNYLTNYEKLLIEERKDPFAAQGEKNDFPDYTEWDKFAMYEYKRLSSEEDENENVNLY